MSLARNLARMPRGVLTVLSFLFVGLLWWVDYATGPELSPLVFYAVPVVLVVWYVGRTAAVWLSVFAAFAWFLADSLTGRPASHPAIPYWNGLEKLLFFLLLTHVVATLKAALEREQLARQEFLERELRIAEQVQERLLPQAPPRLSTLECAGVCRPARGVGGDFFDFLPMEANRFGLALGDVSGKGLSAALLMASLQGTLRSFASIRNAGASEVVADTNRQMCTLTESNRFVTLFFGIYDDAKRQLVCVNAGHNPPFLIRADSPDGPERLVPDGTVLGLFPKARWKQQTLELRAQDLIVAFTDGVPDASNARDEEFGEARLQAAIARHRDLPVKELCAAILGEIAEFLDGAPAPDDVTLLVMRGRAPEKFSGSP